MNPLLRRYSSTILRSSVGAPARHRVPTPSVVSVVAAGALLSSAGAVWFVQSEVGDLEGFQRACRFYSVAIPAYSKYRYLQAFQNSGSDEDEETWRQLHVAESKKGLDTILELRGFYIKNGQMCASNIGNAFPKVWQNTMSVLQDRVPPRPFSVVREVVEGKEGEYTFDVGGVSCPSN